MNNDYVLQGLVCEEGRNKVHDQWTLLLQPGPDHQRGRRRWRASRFDQGFEEWELATHVKKLGTELAEQRIPQRTDSVLQGHYQRRQDCGEQQRGFIRLGVR